MFAVGLGYPVVGSVLAIYLNVLTAGRVKNAGSAIISALGNGCRSSWSVFALFICGTGLILVRWFIGMSVTIFIVELVFPLGCEPNLDLCSIVKSRWVFFRYALLTVTFYHWVIGAMFMYVFYPYTLLSYDELKLGRC